MTVAETAEFPRSHNLPPDLASVLEVETDALKTRADELVAAAGRATVTNAETAEKATLLVGMMISASKKIETARVERKEPFLSAGRTVDQHFSRLQLPLIGNDPKGRLGGAAGKVKGMIEAWSAEEDRKAAIERKRLLDEAAALREAAAKEEAERQAQEAEANRAAMEAGKPVELPMFSVENEIAAAQTEAKVAELTKQAAAVTVAASGPIDTGYGVKASARTKYVGTIDDLTAALKHARKIQDAKIKEAVQSILDAQVRAGVREFPGCTIAPEKSLMIRGA